MVHEMITSLPVDEVIGRAKEFFRERVPHYGAYLEHAGSGYATFRGQGGEEIAVAAMDGDDGTRVRASTLLYDQALGRFLSTLPAVASEVADP